MRRQAGVQEVAAGGGRVRPAPPSRRAGALAVLLALGTVSLAGWLAALFPGDNLRYDAGWAGKPGRFTAAHCAEQGAGKSSHRLCSGVFDSADGTVTGRQVTLDDARVDVGRPVTLRLRPDGGYAVPGWDNVLFDLGGCFALLGGAGAVVAFVGIAPRGVVVRREVPSPRTVGRGPR
ncbi:hypothetical protein ACFQZC_06465 [Streptacidiphilus monticola]